MSAQFVNKFLKVIGIGGNEDEVYEDGYDENYNDDEYIEETDDDADMYSQQGGARSRARASVREVEDANNRPTKAISVHSGMSSSKMVIRQPTC